MIDRVFYFFEAGGWVMYPLVILSVCSLTMIFERMVFWALSPQRRSSAQLHRCLKLSQSNDRSGFFKHAQEDESREGQLLANLNGNPNTAESSVYSQIELYRSSLTRFSSAMGGIIAGAPLLGILGTVTGIITCFDLLGDAAAVSDPSLVAGGIAEALYTTAFGLIIALVTLFPHVYFKSRANTALAH